MVKGKSLGERETLLTSHHLFYLGHVAQGPESEHLHLAVRAALEAASPGPCKEWVHSALSFLDPVGLQLLGSESTISFLQGGSSCHQSLGSHYSLF